MKFKNHLTEVAKKRAVKAIAAGLAISVLLPALTGCDAINEILPIDDIIDKVFPPETLPPFETNEIRPVEEIEETGITAEDVLALYDDLALDMVKARYGTEDLRSRLIAPLDQFSAQFIELNTEYQVIAEPGQSISNRRDYLEFFYMLDEKAVENTWVSNSGTFYQNPEPLVYNVYIFSFKANARLLDHEEEFFEMYLLIDKSRLEDMFSAFEIVPFILTEEFANNSKHVTFSNNHIGETVYPQFAINIETIQNANQEQLWSLYNLLDSIRSINFYGENEDINKDYIVDVK